MGKTWTRSRQLNGGGAVGRLLAIVVSTLVVVATGIARAEVPVVISDQGWTITASRERGVLSLSHESLGPVLQNIRLNLQDSDGPGLLPMTGWSVEQSSRSVLTLHTVHPIAAWTFEISHNTVKISSTFTTAVLTAEAPAPLSRIPVRTLDPQGFPVDWLGTNEAMLEYGGRETRSQSFLPRKNPEVMYFALGLAPGSTFHDLFDRKA